ncbi:MAG: two pore domain potassium channel family protein [Ktedonobacterales bacterium]|nr:two pore domain potassium channel family protein [Ktedonobacterales bacterium]
MAIRLVVGLLGGLLILGILWDTFETIVLPRRVSRRFRFARYFLETLWRGWSEIGRTRLLRPRREGYLSLYGPLSLLLLLGTWAVALVFGFGLLQWALGSQLHGGSAPISLGTDLYMSGTTFFTLGLGDITPRSAGARLITVVEAGVGFGFLALVIGYLPVLYQAFSRREVCVSLLDARAGSPPTAIELLGRGGAGDLDGALTQLLREWELWSAELLESHLSYPALAYFRSQHESQSWLAALAAILDISALVISGIGGSAARRQARLTFAIARHAAVDLSQVLDAPWRSAVPKRLPLEEMARLRERLDAVGFALPAGEEINARLTDLREMYEPYLQALSDLLLMQLPPWVPALGKHDAWLSAPREDARAVPLL